MKTLKSVLMVAIIFLALIALTNCTRNQARVISTWSGGIGMEYDVNRASEQRGNYEWFYDQYGAIKAASQKVKILGLDTEEGKANLMNIASWIEEYNSRSSMSLSRGRWMPTDIPDKLDFSDFGLNY
jgi:S-methylmethionine-dependent homocysteine/selenocysteine methylase